MLLQLSALVCALPWVRELELNPVQVTAVGAAVVDARIVVDPRRQAIAGRLSPHGDPSRIRSSSSATRRCATVR